MSGILGVLSGGGGTGTKAAVVTITPSSGLTPRTVSLATIQDDGHIFYTKVSDPFGQPDGVMPTHSGDVATGSTVRIGTNHGTVLTGSGYVVIQAITYEPGFLDSDYSEGVYTPAGGGP